MLSEYTIKISIMLVTFERDLCFYYIYRMLHFVDFKINIEALLSLHQKGKSSEKSCGLFAFDFFWISCI